MLHQHAVDDIHVRDLDDMPTRIAPDQFMYLRMNGKALFPMFGLACEAVPDSLKRMKQRDAANLDLTSNKMYHSVARTQRQKYVQRAKWKI